MNRRNVLVGLGGVVAGGGALLGTGAFTTVEAQRTVTVNAAGDASALLGLDPSGDGDSSDVVQVTDGLLVIDFGEAARGSQGVNLNGLTTVGDVDIDGSSVDTEALTITNNGTQTVDISFHIEFNEHQGDLSVGEHEVLKLWTDVDESGAQIGSEGFGNLVENDLEDLDPGESVRVALQIDTEGLDTDNVDTNAPLFDSEATITATAQD